MSTYNFDDQHIIWNSLEGIDHLLYSILDIDETNQIVDVLFKLSSNQKIVLHRHKALNVMLVIQGEHKLYKANGELIETRPTGKYTVNPASDKPHCEGGGSDHDAIVLFSIRGSSGVLYEILDDDLNTIVTLSMKDFIALFQAQPTEQA